MFKRVWTCWKIISTSSFDQRHFLQQEKCELFTFSFDYLIFNHKNVIGKFVLICFFFFFNKIAIIKNGTITYRNLIWIFDCHTVCVKLILCTLFLFSFLACFSYFKYLLNCFEKPIKFQVYLKFKRISTILNFWFETQYCVPLDATSKRNFKLQRKTNKKFLKYHFQYFSFQQVSKSKMTHRQAHFNFEI